MTALDLITSALRLINVLAAGETCPIAMANDALAVFNQMIDAWNAERLAIYTTQSQDFALTANKQVYTFGPSGDFDAPRPAQIDGMSAILLYNSSNPIEVPMTAFSIDDWQSKIPVKVVYSSFAQIWYDDGNFPLRNISLWPIPNTSLNKLRIYSWQALAAAANLNSAISFPPGYSEAFRYNLAVRLSAEFAAQLSPTVADLAAKGLARIKTMNAPDLTLQSDLIASPAGYNYKADLFGIGL